MRAAAAVLAALAVSAQANVDFIGAGESFSPPANDYGVTQVTRGDDVYLTTESDVTFTSLFQESADLNFFIGGSKVFTEAGISESASFTFGAGLIPFSFGGSNGHAVINGQNFAQYAGGEEVTFAHADSDTFDFLLGYNDNFAGIGDKDFDDFIVGVDVSEVQIATVPEPGMAALFGLGLIGVGLARMRKRTT
jgi:hypothetical protein